MDCRIHKLYQVVVLWLLAFTLIKAEVDLRSCNLKICHPCFSTDVTCITRDKGEVLPQYLNASLIKLALMFVSPDSFNVKFCQADIQRYSQLQHLTISGDFSSIELGTFGVLPNLNTLHIEETFIAHLPDYLLANNNKLKEIYFVGNNFTELPSNIFNSSGNISVNSYTFNKHGLVLLPCINGTHRLPLRFSNMKNLKKLDLSYNTFYGLGCSNISADFFHPVENLTELYIGGTNFIHTNEVALNRLARLKILDISSLAPYKLCPSNVKSLLAHVPVSVESLRLLHWEIDSQLGQNCTITGKSLIGLSRLFKLRKLSFSFGDGLFGPTLFHKTIPKVPRLFRLDLSSCRINSIEENLFAGYRDLWEINLSGNPLGPKDLNFLTQPVSSVKKLVLSNTEIRSDGVYQYQISHLLCNFPKLATISFDSNALDRPPIFIRNGTSCNLTTFPALTHFIASNNVIKQFAGDDGRRGNICSVFQNLRDLLLSNNKLQNLKGLELCRNLQVLHLEHNRLYYLEQSEMARVFQQLVNVTDINLSSNELREIDQELFAGMRNLEIIYANDNKLDRITKGMFRMNPKLRKIRLMTNYIQYIEATSLDGLRHLQNLNLENNKLTSLSPHLLATLDKMPLTFLGIERNPYDCSCGMKYFQKWILKKTELEKNSLVNIICSSPPHQRDHRVHEYKDNVYDCIIKQVLLFGGIILGAFIATLAIAIPCYKYRWHVKHIRVICKAFRGSVDIVKKEHVCLYDAYVSFDVKCKEDSKWLVEELVPAIEGCEDDFSTSTSSSSTNGTTHQKPLRLYLEPRDAKPGTERFTERQLALEKSKMIIILVSNSYLKRTECLSEANLSGIQMNGTEFFQPNRILLLLRKDLSEEIIRPPISSLLLGKTLQVETEEPKKKQMFREIKKLLSKPLYMYCKPTSIRGQTGTKPTTRTTEQDTETTPLLREQV